MIDLILEMIRLVAWGIIIVVVVVGVILIIGYFLDWITQ